MDIFVEPSNINGKGIVDALNEFGFESLNLSEEDFSQAGKIMQLGYEPVRVDIVTSIDGCTFEEVWNGKVTGIYGKEKVYYIGIKELVKNKQASKRKQDEADLEFLSRVDEN